MRKLSLVPPIEREDGAEHRLRVALATQDGRAMNAHFGSARRFVVYEISESEHHLAETISFEDVADESGKHSPDGDDRVQARIKALSGIQLLFVLAIGGPVAARIIRAGIHPVKLPQSEPIEQVVTKVQEMLRGGERPPWLTKVLKQGQARSMDFLDDED